MKTHPDFMDLVRHSNGELSPEQARKVLQHCWTCAECGQKLGMLMILHSQRHPVRPRHFGSRRWLAAAAVLVAALGVAVFARWLSPEGSDSVVVQIDPDSTTSRPLEPSALATTATIDRTYWLLRHGDVLPTNSVPDPVREGLRATIDEEYRVAIDVLEGWVSLHAEDTEASAYLGIALYLSGDVSERVLQLLELGRADRYANRISTWYLANAFLARGEIDRATSLLEELSETTNRPARLARSLLSRLAPFSR